MGDKYKVSPNYDNEGWWDKTKRVGGDLAGNPNTWKVLAALGLAGALGYGAHKMGENSKMRELERASLGLR